MSQTPETRSVTRSINVVDKDIADFDALAAKGVKLFAQMVLAIHQKTLCHYWIRLDNIRIFLKNLKEDHYYAMVANITSNALLCLPDL